MGTPNLAGSALTDRIAEVLRQHKPFPGGTFADGRVSKVCRCPHCGWEGDNPDAHVAERVAEALHEVRADFKERLELAATTLDGMYQKALHPSDPGMSRLAGKAEGVRLALSYLAESERA